MSTEAGRADRFITAVPLRTNRLNLLPLTVADATEMTDVLGDPAIYQYIGGEPPTAAELHARYELLEGQRSPDGTQGWLNWIVSSAATDSAVGLVQATVVEGATSADVAWIIAPRWQGRGYASEAAAALVTWLGSQAVVHVTAYVHPHHEASRQVAAAAGLTETDHFQDGEQRWTRRFSAAGGP